MFFLELKTAFYFTSPTEKNETKNNTQNRQIHKNTGDDRRRDVANLSRQMSSLYKCLA